MVHLLINKWQWLNGGVYKVGWWEVLGRRGRGEGELRERRGRELRERRERGEREERERRGRGVVLTWEW